MFLRVWKHFLLRFTICFSKVSLLSMMNPSFLTVDTNITDASGAILTPFSSTSFKTLLVYYYIINWNNILGKFLLELKNTVPILSQFCPMHTNLYNLSPKIRIHQLNTHGLLSDKFKILLDLITYLWYGIAGSWLLITCFGYQISDYDYFKPKLERLIKVGNFSHWLYWDVVCLCKKQTVSRTLHVGSVQNVCN